MSGAPRKLLRGTRAGIEGHGLSAREQAIMDRHEAGMPFADIAEELGLAVAYTTSRPG